MPGIDLAAELGTRGFSPPTRDRLLCTLQRARLDLMAIASQRALWEDVAAGNAETHAAIQCQAALRGWVVVTPVHPDASVADLRRYLGQEAFLGAWLHPRGPSQLASDGTQEILTAYRRYTRPLMVTVPDEAAVRDLETLAKQMPQLKVIAAGAGGDAWLASVAAAKRAVNVMLEPFTGGCHRGKLEAMVEVLGSHRILFATGFPAWNPGAALGLLADAKISDADKQAILTGNARKMFGLGQNSTG
ncbi:MAG: amidohydrolase family protein [Armatimonadetes bacterium]|nr:amidohydrolase family protein [Armatimonadota bacterium]